MIPPDKKHNQPPEDLEGVYFTRGPMYINHFYEISKCGINALRLYQYIRTVQGLKWPSLNETSLSLILQLAFAFLVETLLFDTSTIFALPLSSIWLSFLPLCIKD